VKRKISPVIDSPAAPWLIGVMAASDKSSQSAEREREARLAAALRANLRRRKQAAPPKTPTADEK